MVKRRRQNRQKKPVPQAQKTTAPEPNKIGAGTHYDFSAKNLTPYGGLFPVATMLEKLGFQALVEETITCSRITRVMNLYQFVLAIVLGLYVGLERLNQLRFIADDPMVTGIVKAGKLPPQSTLWRFPASLGRHVADQLLRIQRELRQRVWATANVALAAVTIDTDTTVHTLYGKQMGARKSYNPKNTGKLSYQPILTFIAETREYLMGELHNGDRPTGKQIATHIRRAVQALPAGIGTIYARADSGFYCWEAVQAYLEMKCQFVIVARKTSRLVEELKKATWTASPRTDAHAQCEFWYQPDGWDQPCRFAALRYEKEPDTVPPEETEQYQLFATTQYVYRVFVTNMTTPIADTVWFYLNYAQK